MARPELGVKRQCMNCGAKFYDLAKDPALCPKCGTVFQMGAGMAVSRVAAPVVAARPAPVEEEDADVETAGPELVSLDEVEAAESAGADPVDDETEIEETAAADDTFLEEEEEGDDDVADLIDGDIENDEET